jgi:HSP20 family molecular chaperone IbpA
MHYKTTKLSNCLETGGLFWRILVLNVINYIKATLSVYFIILSVMISRNFLRELRPLFRMLDEPLTRGSPVYWNSRSPFEIPFVSQSKVQPAVDITEEGNSYVVEAELPGVKKDDVQLHIGDGGHSIIIEGKVSSRSRTAPQQSGAESTTSEQPAQGMSIDFDDCDLV